MIAPLLALATLAGCPVEEAPCERASAADLRVAPEGVELGAFETGEPLWYGLPPQGGAPYTPLHAEVGGLATPQQGVTVTVFATDLDDGADLGSQSYDTRLLCANVGPSAGRWVLPSVHHRYFGWSLEELEGRRTALTLVLTDLEGNEVATELEGILTQDAP